MDKYKKAISWILAMAMICVLGACSPAEEAVADGSASLWFDRSLPDSPDQGQMKLDAFPGVEFHWDFTPGARDSSQRLIAEGWGKETELFSSGYTEAVYACDITGDGNPDLCANVYYMFSGIPSYYAVMVYDYKNGEYYLLADNENINHDTKISYLVRLDGEKLVCDRVHERTSQVLATGVLALEEGQLRMQETIAYDPPMKYIFTGEDRFWDKTTLTVLIDGTCQISFDPRLNEDGTANWAQGTYEKTEDMLVMRTEDGRKYSFSFQGKDLRFEKAKSDPLPTGCPLKDGSVLKATPFFN